MMDWRRQVHHRGAATAGLGEQTRGDPLWAAVPACSGPSACASWAPLYSWSAPALLAIPGEHIHVCPCVSDSQGAGPTSTGTIALSREHTTALEETALWGGLVQLVEY